jgi:glutaredoxin-dependent peroxiredoxin
MLYPAELREHGRDPSKYNRVPKSELSRYSYLRRETHAENEGEDMTETATGAPRIGETAPDFTLADVGRKPVSLRDFRGETVILLFFPAAFSGTCAKELCTFRDSASRLNDSKSRVLGISVDLPWALREYQKANGFDFPLLSDYDRQAIEAYGIVDRDFLGFTSGVAQRSVFVIDPAGTIVWEWISDVQGQEPNYDDVIRAAQEASASG